ncbi:Sbal_3080 family lipoprotein [Pseudidiomarina aquimaris]|uniref:Sbal_3080 family lipoprotein n=1 Tax=Pseudidiomarina aquimaris TaxID=641841 RepID=UPI003A97EDB8
MKNLILCGLALALTGCTAIDVNQVSRAHQVDHVCIENNPKVIVDGFVDTVTDIFYQRGISSEVYAPGMQPEHCEVVMMYTALRSWDFAPYLSYAELSLFKENTRIGYAEYRLRGKGGLALNKWASVESKMTPVVEQLLGQYPITN